MLDKVDKATVCQFFISILKKQLKNKTIRTV